MTQAELDRLAWLLSRKLSRRQNDVILVSKMMQTALHQLPMQDTGGNSCIWYFCRSSGLIISSDWEHMVHLELQVMEHRCGDSCDPISDWVVPTQSCRLWMSGSEMDLRGQRAFCESCCSHHLLAGSAFEPSKAQEDRAAKAEQFGLPGFLFGLWIKWSPGLGGGATSCPCLASKGSYSLPS